MFHLPSYYLKVDIRRSQIIDFTRGIRRKDRTFKANALKFLKGYDDLPLGKGNENVKNAHCL